MQNEEIGQQTKMMYNIWTKNFEGKCLGTFRKMKSVICTVLPWIYTICFERIQIFLFGNKVFNFIIYFSGFIMSFLINVIVLLFFMILCFMAKLPYSWLVLWWKCLWWKRLQLKRLCQRCLWGKYWKQGVSVYALPRKPRSTCLWSLGMLWQMSWLCVGDVPDGICPRRVMKHWFSLPSELRLEPPSVESNPPTLLSDKELWFYFRYRRSQVSLVISCQPKAFWFSALSTKLLLPYPARYKVCTSFMDRFSISSVASSWSWKRSVTYYLCR